MRKSDYLKNFGHKEGMKGSFKIAYYAPFDELELKKMMKRGKFYG